MSLFESSMFLEFGRGFDCPASLVFKSLVEMAIVAVARTTSNVMIVIVGYSGIMGFTESTLVEGETRLTVRSVASSESSTSSKANPVEPTLVTVNVTVAIVPLPLNAGVLEPVEVAKRWYFPVDCEAVSSTTSIGQLDVS